ncbi:glycosyltransferase [Pseudoalteromonas sp. SWYJZ19]|uniref:glycosyltransferase n=1 Tax=Pseudoalteromonas sp. SWYJZ19 TaxID=2792068 RepID=UPI0018CE1D3E|nr:glycosyltransferase [Pseudoalteromonas sp. SWYJZ19]MBH0048909.1 glycosyltransferase [Pseudoalteromonas sp. SWYJZ19]
MLKVAHVFKSLSAGGIEKWLTDIAIHNNTSKDFELHFLLQSKDKGFFEEQIPNNSVQIKKSDLKRSFFKYCIEMYKQLKTEKYDVVHSHVHHFSGIVVFIAFLAGVKVRVAQSHNDKRDEYKNVSFQKKAYFAVCKLLLKLFANKKIAVSDKASKSLFQLSKNVYILPCGLRLVAPLPEQVNKNNEPIIIGHVGSFSKQKNHNFICELAKAINDEFPNSFKFKLVGGGELLTSIRDKVRRLNLDNTITFLGLRDDVKELMLYDFDYIILPSLHEGLAMVALESQYYGKPLIVSDTLSKQHTLSDYILYKSINGVDDFKNTILNLQMPKVESILECRSRLDKSPLSIRFNMERLNEIYVS